MILKAKLMPTRVKFEHMPIQLASFQYFQVGEACNALMSIILIAVEHFSAIQGSR
jgi:hypothetical protein